MTRSLLSIAALLATAAASPAAVVTFSSAVISPTDTTGSFLDNSGTILDAVSFGPTRNPAYTYNPVGTGSNPNSTPTLNGITFVSSAGSTAPTGSHFAIGQAGGSGTIGYDNGRFSNVTSSNQGLYGLVYDVVRTGSNDARMTVNLTNLTLGSTYEVQMIFSEINNQDNLSNTADRTVQIAAGAFTAAGNTQTGTGSDGNSTVYSYGPTTGAIEVTATFTADNSTELLNLLSNTTGGFSRVSLAGIVVSQVPEASTSMLAAAGVAALAFSRRRRA